MSDSPRQRTHIPALDGLRGLAILLVIAHHAGVFPHGWVGVDLFFVLSGYLITGILVAAKGWSHYWRNFLARRALRILPASIAFLALVLVVSPLVRGRPLPPHQGWVWSYLANIGVAWHGWEAVPGYATHLWSLAVEEQFYLVWPAVVLVCSVPTLRRVCAWGIGIAFALRLAFHLAGGTGLAPYVLTPMRMDALLVGAWLAITPISRSVAHAVGGVAGLLTAIILVMYGPHDALVETVGYTTIALTAGALLSIVIASKQVARVLSWRALRFAGRYSYAAYLWHIFVIMQVEPRLHVHGAWPVFVIGSLATFAVAWVSGRLIEAPFLRLKRYFPEPHQRYGASAASATEAMTPAPVSFGCTPSALK